MRGDISSGSRTRFPAKDVQRVGGAPALRTHFAFIGLRLDFARYLAERVRAWRTMVVMDQSNRTQKPRPADPYRQFAVMEFVRMTNAPDIWWAAIPIFFIALKFAGIAFVSAATADTIVGHLSAYWPVLSDQYKKIGEVASEIDKRNFGPFCVAAFLFGMIVIIQVVFQYIKRHANVRWTNRDLFWTFVSFLATYLFSIFDSVKDSPNPFWNFYVDSYGMYYFR